MILLVVSHCHLGQSINRLELLGKPLADVIAVFFRICLYEVRRRAYGKHDSSKSYVKNGDA